MRTLLVLDPIFVSTKNILGVRNRPLQLEISKLRPVAPRKNHRQKERPESVELCFDKAVVNFEHFCTTQKASEFVTCINKIGGVVVYLESYSLQSAEKYRHLQKVDLQSFFSAKLLVGETIITSGIVCDLALFLSSLEARQISVIPVACISGSVTYRIFHAIAQFFPNRTSDDSLRLRFVRCIKERKSLVKNFVPSKWNQFLTAVVTAAEKREVMNVEVHQPENSDDWGDVEMATVPPGESWRGRKKDSALRQARADLFNLRRKYARLEARIQDCPKCKSKSNVIFRGESKSSVSSPKKILESLSSLEKKVKRLKRCHQFKVSSHVHSQMAQKVVKLESSISKERTRSQGLILGRLM